MLFVVLLLVNDDVAVDEDVVEEKEASGLEAFAAMLLEHSLTHQDAALHIQRLARRAETALHHGNPSVVGNRVFWTGKKMILPQFLKNKNTPHATPSLLYHISARLRSSRRYAADEVREFEFAPPKKIQS